MRHLFDQYEQPENRLTHALVCCLEEDPKLLRRFVGWVLGSPPPRGSRLQIIEQRLPGEDEAPEEEAGRRGLPDAWVFNDDGWALILESKIASAVSVKQLRRHRATAERRGFDDIHVLAIDVTCAKKPLPRNVLFRTWSEVYVWFERQTQDSAWAQRFASYMEVAEGRMASDGYLKEGTLTVFSGIPFDEDSPYSYREAKRVLNLAMDKLQARKDLAKQLDVDPRGQRRPAITGKGGSSVWDYLPVRQARKAESFVQYPHLTLAIQQDHVLAELIVPHNIKRAFKRKLIELGDMRFFELLRSVERRLARALKGARGAAPLILTYQRRYPTQRSPAIVDAKLEFDLRTAFKSVKGKPRIGYQPQWLEATYRALTKKKSNLQIGIGAAFPYACPVVGTAKVLDCIAKAWLATEPVFRVLLGK